jgi:hypothetical protein
MHVEFVNENDSIKYQIDGKLVTCQVLRIQKGHGNDLWDVRYQNDDGSWRQTQIIPETAKLFKEMVCL